MKMTFSTDSPFCVSKRSRQPRRTPRSPKTAPMRAPRWLQTAAGRPKRRPRRPKRGPRQPKMAPRRLKRHPRWPQTAPRRSQRRPTRPKRAPKGSQEAQKGPLGAPKRTTRGFKVACKRKGWTRRERPLAGAKEQLFPLLWPWGCPAALPTLLRRRSDASDADRDGATFDPTRSRVRRNPCANLPTLLRPGLLNTCISQSSNTSAPASVHWAPSVGEQPKNKLQKI